MNSKICYRARTDPKDAINKPTQTATQAEFAASIQGHLANNVHISYSQPYNQSTFYIKNWSLNPNPLTPTDELGTVAQGQDDPSSIFYDHAVVEYGDKLYDPSYGSGPFLSHLDWEDASVAAYGADILYSFDGINQAGLYTWIWKMDKKGTAETILDNSPDQY